MFALDNRRGDNTVAINVELPDGGNTQVHLDFESEYTKQQLFRTLSVEQKGKWIVGVLSEDLLPETGQYTVTVYDTVEDLISLDELHAPLFELEQPLDDLRGDAHNEIIKVIRAVVLGEDYPVDEQPTEVSRVTHEPTAKTNIIHEPSASESTVSMPMTNNTIAQADETEQIYHTYEQE